MNEVIKSTDKQAEARRLAKLQKEKEERRPYVRNRKTYTKEEKKEEAPATESAPAETKVEEVKED